jgi:hypothetical protein
MRLRVPADYTHAYRGYAGKQVIFGIRAEDIHDQPAGPAWQPVDANVVALETLGAEVVLVFGINGLGRSDIAARLGRDYRAPIGSTQQLYIDLGEMQLFDPQTTNAIPRGASPSGNTPHK